MRAEMKRMTDIEQKLDEADLAASASNKRYPPKEVFNRVRKRTENNHLLFDRKHSHHSQK